VPDPVEVLFVDLNPDTPSPLLALLTEQEAAGFRISPEVRLPAAVATLEQRHVGLVLIRAVQAGALLLEEVENLRMVAPAVPILLLHDGVAECSLTECLEAGAQVCLSTPGLTGAQLTRAMRLAMARMRAEPARSRREGEDAPLDTALRHAFDQSPTGMAITDDTGRCLRANAALARMLGYSESELPDLSWRDVVHPDEIDATVLEWQRLSADSPALELETRWVHQQGHTLRILLTAVMVPDSEDEPVQYVVQVRDATLQRRMEAEAGFLSDASHLLAAALDHETTVRSIARLAVPRLADWCTIELRDGARIRTADSAAGHPDDDRVLGEIRTRYPRRAVQQLCPVSHALETGDSTLWRVMTPDRLGQIAQDEEHLEMLLMLAPVSMMIVPLVTRGRIIGAALLATNRSGLRYDRRDLDVAEAMAHMAALAIDNARLLGQKDPAAIPLPASVLEPGQAPSPALAPDPESATAASVDPLRELTDQERRVLALSARGLTAADISARLFLSPRTVETYRSRAMRKLDLSSRAELVSLALRTGLLTSHAGQVTDPTAATEDDS
jgi:PAS domain S-box-containing protein